MLTAAAPRVTPVAGKGSDDWCYNHVLQLIYMNKLLVAVGAVVLLIAGTGGFMYAAYKGIVPAPKFAKGIILDKKFNQVYEQYCSAEIKAEPVIVSEKILGTTTAEYEKNVAALYEGKDIERINLALLMLSGALNFLDLKDQETKDAWTYTTQDLLTKNKTLQEERSKFIEDISKQDTNVLLDNLLQNRYSKLEVPLVMRTAALNYAEERKFDPSFNMYMCNAQKYYDPFSMYYVARIFALGDKGVKSAVPEVVMKSKVQVDLKEAYFWMSSLAQIAVVYSEDFLGNGETVSDFYNKLKEDLKDDPELSQIDQARVRIFVAERYPQYEKFNTIIKDILTTNPVASKSVADCASDIKCFTANMSTCTSAKVIVSQKDTQVKGIKTDFVVSARKITDGEKEVCRVYVSNFLHKDPSILSSMSASEVASIDKIIQSREVVDANKRVDSCDYVKANWKVISSEMVSLAATGTIENPKAQNCTAPIQDISKLSPEEYKSAQEGYKRLLMTGSSANE